MLLSSIFSKAYSQPAILALADGTLFHGNAMGADGFAVAEIVFNTSMTGYQEILTDPSYSGQIVTLTYPHIGNTGMNAEDTESDKIHAAGLVVRDCALRVSNFRAKQSLPEALKAQGVVAIAGVDTRKLTRILRETGAQGACILVGTDTQHALELARGFHGMAGQDLAKTVSVVQPRDWTQATWKLGEGYRERQAQRFHVVAYDFGVKTNILRLLAERDCKITLVPAQTPFADVLALQPDGVFLSNGPGDPAPCDYAIETARQAMAHQLPLFGICLGQQIMALALGARVTKMKNGHHGGNHPVKDMDSGRVFITSQNHEYNVQADSLPDNARVTHVSLFDGSVQGFALHDTPAFCFQGHPEASPGPHDIMELFDRFVALMHAKS